MKIVVTGAGGFLGARLADALLDRDSPLCVTELLLVDIKAPPSREDHRVRCLGIDLTAPNAADKIVTSDVNVLFHLAAVVSGHAEADLDVGLSVNFDSTRAILNAARNRAPKLRLIFTSTVGVFGGDLPSVIEDITATTPQNSYGTAKAMCELLINDYSRRGYVDGRVVRLPTVSVRAGAANRAVTSFASGIVREPLNGEVAVCPVPPELELWLTSPATVVRNIVHAATLSAKVFGAWRAVNLPGYTVSVGEILRALRAVAGAAVVDLVRFEPDEGICRIVESFPVKFDNSRALSLGFTVDTDFEEVIRAYIREDLKG